MNQTYDAMAKKAAVKNKKKILLVSLGMIDRKVQACFFCANDQCLWFREKK